MRAASARYLGRLGVISPGGRGKNREISGLPEHLVDLRRVHLLGQDHLPREFLERN
jgi:hypothetical protein